MSIRRRMYVVTARGAPEPRVHVYFLDECPSEHTRARDSTKSRGSGAARAGAVVKAVMAACTRSCRFW